MANPQETKAAGNAKRNEEAVAAAEAEAKTKSESDKATAAAAEKDAPGEIKVTPGKYKSAKFRQVDPYTGLVFLTSRPTDVEKVTNWFECQVLAGILIRVGDL